MLSSQLLTSLCGIAIFQLASAHDEHLPSFTLESAAAASVAPVALAASIASGAPIASPAGSLAAKPSVNQVNKHENMGSGCKHNKQKQNQAQNAKQKHVNAGNRSFNAGNSSINAGNRAVNGSAVHQVKAVPTTLATMARSNLTIAMAVQNSTSVEELFQASATATIVVVTQQVIPVQASAGSASVAVSSGVSSAAAVTMSPVAQAAKVAAEPSSEKAKKAAAASSVVASSVVANPGAKASGAATSGSTSSGTVSAAAGSGLTTEQLVAVMPSSSSCTSATPAGECLSAAQAAPLLVSSFSKYGIDNKGAQAAIIALIALESGELKYSQHYTNGAPAKTGQGTYNEMSPSFVVEYAKALYTSQAPSDPLAAMNKINASPGDSVGSAAWFLKTKCSSVIAQFATSPDSAWSTYITSGSCIGTTMTAERTKYWTAAKKALGV